MWTMRAGRLLGIGCAVLFLGFDRAAAEPPKVVASIVPIHSLVASVMKDVGRPYLLLKGGSSPHSYTLRPSEARQLSEARVVFWVGEGLEAFLEKPLGALGGEATQVALHQAKGVHLLETRKGGVRDAEDRQTEHEPDKADAHDHKRHGHDDHDHDRDEHEGHKHGAHDMHIWLDPHNAEAMVRAIAGALSEADPANAPAYRRNAQATIARIEALEEVLERALAPIRGRRYLVFHDAYQYFEKRYKLSAAGSITVNPQQGPGARRLVEIRGRIDTSRIRCVFVEPQFPPKLVDTLIDGTGARKATLDPLGVGVQPGPDAYFILMRKLASALTGCLG